MPGIDLHVHTIQSDGTFTPTQAVELAAGRLLSTIAITDHDTVNGLAEAQRAGQRAGVEIVPGVEFSTVYDGEGVHILCYFMDVDDPDLTAELQRLRDDRFRRGERMVERLQELGYPISFERVRLGEHVPGTFAEYVVVPARNVFPIPASMSFPEAAAFPLVYQTAWRMVVGRAALRPGETVLIHGAGGVCVLAHPGTWRETSPVPPRLVDELADAGLEGIEASHPEHTPEVEARYIEQAGSLGLIWTGSSDCHGERYDPVRLGMRTTPPEQFERLKARAEALRATATR